ncbi:Os02g0247100 [Oryza sativa Japonica Group]|uniref:Os02g0247100 protein n=1 Tax=Oryza sativa subsp. japonica TaxID=39947 RepID=A0A0N7KF06_ORYSJ|nr:Os02g0247100 [Oryza sativa Japonica Group]
MAQLPPRAPSAAAAAGQEWSAMAAAGEFLGFAAARRGAHRRSASDSAAFLMEAAVPMDDVIVGVGGGGEFDRLDDEQLMSMFSDVEAPAVSAAADGIADPKRVKRLVAINFAVKIFCFSIYHKKE